jgi:predicted dehydrogenase
MKIAFIGAGGIAGNYLGSLKKLERPVSAICDLNADRAQKVAAENNAQSYTDYKGMLAQEKPDAVFICVPPGAHDTQVEDAAKAGAALFVAKPIGLNFDTVLRTRDVIDKAGVINQVGYMARYSDITERAKELVGGRQLTLGFGRFMCRMGANHPWWGKGEISGGQMLEQSTHVFDWLRYFLGEVEEVAAYGHKGAANDVADFEDSTTCNLRFQNGAIGNIVSTCCANTPKGFAAELSGRDFYLKAVMDNHLHGVVENENVEFYGEEAGYFRQVEKFLKAVESNAQNSVRSSYEDAARTLAVTLAANQSLQSGKPEKVTSL